MNRLCEFHLSFDYFQFYDSHVLCVCVFIAVFHLYEPVLTDIDVPIENAVYFRAVDRATAEDILRDRVDGSCLVRPYKQKVRNSILCFRLSILIEFN